MTEKENDYSTILRSWVLPLYRGLMLALLVGTFSWAWSTDRSVTLIEASFGERLREHARLLDWYNDRITYLERKQRAGLPDEMGDRWPPPL